LVKKNVEFQNSNMMHNLNDFLIKIYSLKKNLKNSSNDKLIEQKAQLMELKKEISNSINSFTNEEEKEKLKALKELYQQLNQLEKDFQKKIEESNKSTTTELCGKSS
jgi:predicted Rossmann fold nucleotide-binding protein DprA/Smf involved in DNA uptake